MYSYEWDSSTGGYVLTPTPLAFSKEPRPVYYKELNILGFDKHWKYDKNDCFPYMWAEANNYFYRGRLVAKVKGGSCYTAPEIVLIEDPEPNSFPLRFVDIPAMVEKNGNIIEQLAQDTIKKIYNTFVEYQKKVDVFYVAFSGGKDSVVTLDLVQRALPHNSFKVLFGDTGMEFPDTYKTVEEVKKVCAEGEIEFLTSRSQYEPDYTWSKFGPPATVHRWCCSVHKTSPQIIVLRDALGKPDFTGMAFIGVRASESLSRSEYDYVSLGEKHKGQYSCNPILEWNSAELYAYIYLRQLYLNEAYKKGNRRAGCLVCPRAAERNEYMARICYPAQFNALMDKVRDKAEGYFSDGDPDKRKILDRFVSPIHISLPENIAFELMNQAMKKTEDEDKAAKWEKNRASLDRRSQTSRAAVRKAINLTDEDLTNVLPIHPYAALLLQHISIYYTSTARSMFNFIKNDEGEQVHAFQWFIDNYDFKSRNPFLTADMLWNFFYETGSQKLADGIKEVLSCYTPKLDKELLEDEKSVLKVILLLQAVSERMTGNRDIFLPNNRNLELAFEGTDLQFTAPKIAMKMLNDHVITRTPLTGDVFSYCCKNNGPNVDSTPFIAQAKQKSTKDMTFMAGSNLRSTIEFTGALRLRYSLAYATLSDFDSEIKKANNPSTAGNKLYVVATIGRDSSESGALKKKIENFFESNRETNAVVVDSSSVLLGESEYTEFVENYAMALAIANSDIDQRKTYEGYAIEVLSNWAKRIKNGAFYVYSRYAPNGERVANIADLFEKLMDIDKFHYPQCLESTFTSVLNTMYDANSLGAGATCGITEETKGTFRSGNEATKLENALKGAWKVPEYWKTSHIYIANLKRAVTEIIDEAFDKSDRISILHRLDLMGICVSTGSACDSVSTQISHVLKAIKLKDNYARGTIRISFGKENTFEEANIIAESLIRILKK